MKDFYDWLDDIPDWWCLDALKYEFGEYVDIVLLHDVLDNISDSMYKNEEDIVSYNNMMRKVYYELKEAGRKDVPFRMNYYSLKHYNKWRSSYE